MAAPSSRRRRPRRTSLLEHIHPHAGGIDCGARHHVVAVPADRDAEPVQTFGTTTPELRRLVGWLQACRVTTVAMEATGVYWVPLYELLEGEGLQVALVNAQHVKHVPTRKTDVSDAEWLRDLHTVGLVRGSFRPADHIVTLRTYLRHRATLVQDATTYVHRMQKALDEMNVRLHHVVSDITGQTGLAIIRAILAGQRDPAVLAGHRNYRCHAAPADIIAALTGTYRPEHVFTLQQNFTLYEAVQRQIAACDDTAAAYLAHLAATAPAPATPLPAARRRPRAEDPAVDVRPLLHRLTGADLTQVEALGPASAMSLVAEIGTDMTRWPTAKHFVSWLTFAPRNKTSGGRVLSARTPRSANRAAAILRMAAMTLGRTQTALGAFYRRLAYRAGKAKAITATARKLATLVYTILKHGTTYVDPGAAAYTERQRAAQLRSLRRRAAALGLTLLDSTTGELVGSTVS